ncbi:glycosyltransferase involved in cell wall biosynthesis [Salibacterium salarium]|uniref:GT4 family glycosyltransferase PelF n=1 Tax=Salibacterium salarium TaxID=284579 RepID=UPI00277D9452|nr:GT4 family glycosyltransferase PelF [Salibacterium salarium]MDQ0300119.1 glycosyltransferase involved in cell wall biosynthesis [Salibacterium salarium]
MKVGIVAEGSYPYISGGVSSWIHMLIQSMPKTTFEIIAISDQPRTSADYKYSLPSNVSGVTDICLTEQFQKMKGKASLSTDERNKLLDWMSLKSFNASALEVIGNDGKIGTPSMFFNSPIFWSFVENEYEVEKQSSSFLDYLSMWKSMFTPVFSLLQRNYPDVDVIHAVSTGYAGIVASYLNKSRQIPFILTEHGMYAREREEEILQSHWVPEEFKERWISFFYHMSAQAYKQADDVITLFNRNSRLQEWVGAPSDKLKVIPNGVSYQKLAALPRNNTNETLKIGAIVRVVPIKDIKTMIQAASYLKKEQIPFQLFIMGPMDEDEIYAKECRQLIHSLGLEEEVFMVGKVNIMDYLETMDVCVLSSISEGQPLAVLEGMAAAIPWVVTDVGSCAELIQGTAEDTYGDAGFVVPPVHAEPLGERLKWFYHYPEEGRIMGENGQRRVKAYYQMETMIDYYYGLYRERGEQSGRYRFSFTGVV